MGWEIPNSPTHGNFKSQPDPHELRLGLGLVGDLGHRFRAILLGLLIIKKGFIQLFKFIIQ